MLYFRVIEVKKKRSPMFHCSLAADMAHHTCSIFSPSFLSSFFPPFFSSARRRLFKNRGGIGVHGGVWVHIFFKQNERQDVVLARLYKTRSHTHRHTRLDIYSKQFSFRGNDIPKDIYCLIISSFRL